MTIIKRHFNVRIPNAIWTIGLTIIALTSCKNTPGNDELAPPQTVFKQPVTKPLKFSGTKKIDWAGIKAVSVQPFVDKFDTSKFPVLSYDTSGFKPVTGPVEEAKFDYNSLPSKNFDIDKFPVHKLKFKTYILPPPRLIKAGPAGIKNVHASVHDLAGIPELKGEHFSCLFTDRDGFLWIATLDGLYRYDGENLVLYIAIKSSQYIICMVQDSLGRIWVNEQQNGIDILDIKHGILKKTEHGNGLSGDDVIWLVKDKQNRIWVIFRKAVGVDIIDPIKETSGWMDKTNFTSKTIRATDIIQDNDGNMWITTLSGVIVIDLKNKKIKYLDRTNYLKTDSLLTILQDPDKKIWLAGLHGEISIINIKNSNIQYIKEKRIWVLYKFNSMVWKELENGVEIVDTKKNRSTRITTGNGLDNFNVETLAQDKQGQVWIGTDNGLNMVSSDKAIIEHINTLMVSSLTEDKDGLLWLGTRGIDIINRKTKTFRHFTIHHGPENDTVSTINELNGSIFICSRKGLDIIDPSRTKITHFGKEQGLNSKGTHAVLIDGQGMIWIGGMGNGMDVYDPANKTIKHLGKAQGLSNEDIVDIKEDKSGRIWLSTFYGGIDIIDPGTWIVKYINFVDGGKSIFADNAGNMWIGAKLYDNINNGIYIVNLKKNTVTSFSAPQGLIEDDVSSILQYNNRIYAGTIKGVTIITPPATAAGTTGKWQVESFGKGYGLNRFNATSFLTDVITRDGLYCWGDTGISVLDLSKKDTSRATAFITGISVMDQPDFFTDQGVFEIKDKDTLWDVNSNKHYLKGDTPIIAGYARQGKLTWDKVTGPYNMPINWTLRHDQNFIRFTYSSLNLRDHDTTWYKYRLIGTDKDWSDETTLNSTRNYFSLTPGDYTFEVSSKNADKAWSNPALLSFTIKPPWWQTWWAYILYVCLFAGSTWSFVYYRSRQLVKENRVLEDKVNLRTEEVLQQKEEIFQQKEEIETQRDDLEKTLSHLKTTQTQLIQSAKMASLGELTAGIAHEIQNPLNFVNNFSEVSKEMMAEMKEEIEKGDIDEAKLIANDIEQNLEKIIHHGKRADGIVKGMLEHSRKSSGNKELTDINALGDEYLRLAYHGMRAKDKTFNADMNTDFDNKAGKINIIGQDIGRVLLNLFNNAFYAVAEKAKTAAAGYQPTVTINTKRKDDAVIITVSDNGNGIPENITDKIFQPFFTTKPTGQGSTGLGLSLSYDIIAAHEGEITVVTKEGEGSKFIISLPV